MNAFVLSLLFLSILQISSTGRISEIPFDAAKVNYHRQHLCITIHGTEKCIDMDKSPGDAAEVAQKFRVFIETENAVGTQDDSPGPANNPMDD